MATSDYRARGNAVPDLRAMSRPALIVGRSIMVCKTVANPAQAANAISAAAV
jgi:hypothetical protein